jgi:hypothetical protein
MAGFSLSSGLTTARWQKACPGFYKEGLHGVKPGVKRIIGVDTADIGIFQDPWQGSRISHVILRFFLFSTMSLSVAVTPALALSLIKPPTAKQPERGRCWKIVGYTYCGAIR